MRRDQRILCYGQVMKLFLITQQTIYQAIVAVLLYIDWINQ